ncbi:MAG: peptide-methionine (S)-S-oxide reductase MsrA [Ferroplasma sp.]|uniref:peptide-methionine (S)-S-oxide reductase MsrA n=1 Tax=Ferroplasma sp. TaxID=2591003 RepID=UPI0028149FBD|nr:peptide-methionine (S)-S-oxide reductase MsrA [Ferroplasma sp.]WMT50697.1 MAG: peptide-methionine (S)-S-oxide reductase MsrA [Ferroplasma sp.]
MDEKFIVFGTGCFWCSEAIFKLINGVTDVVPGYAGGHTENPTYRQVCTDKTGHAEVVKVSYNPEVISLNEILDLFMAAHDPTSLNRQGNDIGTQYRSIIFYNTPEEEKTIKDYIAKKQKDYKKPIVTEVKKFEHFYEAEDYHHNYFANNPSNPYCSMVIKPEVNDFIMKHGNVLKTVKH